MSRGSLLVGDAVRLQRAISRVRRLPRGVLVVIVHIPARMVESRTPNPASIMLRHTPVTPLNAALVGVR